MALVKKPASVFWWIDIAVPEALRARVGKPRIRESTGIKREGSNAEQTRKNRNLAQQYHDKVKNDLWRQDKLGEQAKETLGQVVERWKRHAAEKKLRTANETVRKLDWWKEKLGADTPVADIHRRQIMAAVEGMQTHYENRPPKPAEPATINRYLQAMRGLLRLCAGPWELIESAPTLTLRKEPPGRVRVLSKAEIKALHDALPAHWRPLFLLALSTGLRLANVIQLRWDQVDLERSRLLVGSEDFKNGTDFGIPLTESAKAILADQKGKHKTHVFVYEDKPMAGLQSRTLKKALAKAGITNYRWHDNRHTWATNLVEAGVSDSDLMALGGWKDAAMVRRYGHRRTDHLRAPASAADKALVGVLPVDPLVTP